MFRLAFSLILAALLLGVVPAAAQGRPVPGHDVQRLDRILPGVSSQYPGTFYDAEGPYPDAAGGLHYRLKWMTPDGRIMWLDTDARTGRVYNMQPGYPGRSYGGPPRYAAPPRGYPPPARAYPGYGYPRGGYFGGAHAHGWNVPGRPRGYWSGHNGHHGG